MSEVKNIVPLAKGLVAAEGANGIKLLKGEGIQVGEKVFKYEIKIQGKYDSWRVLGNYDSNTGYYIFEVLEKTHK